MLYLVGLGLGDVKDITVRGLEIVRAAKRVFLETYTSVLPVGKAELVSESARRGDPAAVLISNESFARTVSARRGVFCRKNKNERSTP